MNWSKVKSYATSIALASAILFGVGYHPTVDAIIATVAWAFLVIGIFAAVTLSVVLITVRKDKDLRSAKELGPFYKSLQNMHSNIPERIISLLISLYWLYALVVQEWTAPAVVYVILAMYMQFFIYMTRDIAKNYFLERLKGEGGTA